MNLHAPALSTPDNHHVIVHKYEYGNAKHPLLSIHRRWAISKITTLQEKANYHGMPGPCMQCDLESGHPAALQR